MPSLTPRLLLGTVAVALLAACLAHAEPGPRSGRPATPEPPATALAKPAAPVAPALPAPALTPRRLPPVSALDRGGVVTDAGGGGPAGAPNEIERTKLDLARQAVAAARLAGPLMMSRPAPAPEPLTPLDRERAAALKLAAYQAQKPAALPEDRAAGVTLSHAPVQAVGSGALSEPERLKLEALLQGLALPAVASPAPAARDAVVRTPDRKEDR